MCIEKVFLATADYAFMVRLPACFYRFGNNPVHRMLFLGTAKPSIMPVINYYPLMTDAQMEPELRWYVQGSAVGGMLTYGWFLLDTIFDQTFDRHLRPSPYHSLNFINKVRVIDMQNNFDVKTFEGFLATRALTGFARINEHHLLNQKSNVATIGRWLVEGVDNNTFTLLCDILTNDGYLLESRIVAPGNAEAKETDTSVNLEFSLTGFLIIDGVIDVMLNITVDKKSLELNAYKTITTKQVLPDISTLLKDLILEAPIKVNYVCGFTADGKPEVDVRTIDQSDKRPLDCFYPSIPRGVVQLALDFMESNNNLLFMVSEPGMGKSTLVRELCRHYRGKPIYQFAGEKTLAHPSFDSYLAKLPKDSVCVIEDADILVARRDEGNTTMSLLLNEIDGMVSKRIKFIITTNLENRKHVDPALLRPGRCFRTLEFLKLTLVQATQICEEMKRPVPIKNGEESRFTLTELLSGGGDVTATATKIGFQLGN